MESEIYTFYWLSEWRRFFFLFFQHVNNINTWRNSCSHCLRNVFLLEKKRSIHCTQSRFLPYNNLKSHSWLTDYFKNFNDQFTIAHHHIERKREKEREREKKIRYMRSGDRTMHLANRVHKPPEAVGQECGKRQIDDSSTRLGGPFSRKCDAILLYASRHHLTRFPNVYIRLLQLKIMTIHLTRWIDELDSRWKIIWLLAPLSFFSILEWNITVVSDYTTYTTKDMQETKILLRFHLDFINRTDFLFVFHWFKK